MKYCIKCGAQLDDNTKFCPKCGAPQQVSPPSSQHPVPQPQRQTAAPQQNYSAPQGQAPGHGKAVASLVLGIIGVVFWFFGYSSILSLILGIIGLILSSSAKSAGNNEGIRTGGFVLSLISLIGGAIVLIACVACAGTLMSATGLDLDDLNNFINY